MADKKLQYLEFLKTNWPALIVFGLLGRFVIRLIQTSLSFPTLLSSQRIGEWVSPALVFFAATLAILGFLFLGWSRTKWGGSLRARQPAAWLRTHAQPLALALLFFVVYYALAIVFNREDFNTNNTFFAADTNSWRLRLATENGYLMGMRAIHPLAFLILRPAVLLVSTLAASDLFHGALLLLALTGSAGIFFAWGIMKDLTDSATHATLFTTVLGLSTASLVFNSVIETYIFSGFLLILFFSLLRSQKRLPWLVVVGIATFGITISNLVQDGMALLLTDMKLRRVIFFGVAVLVISFGLTFVNQALYPNSSTFLNTGESSGELEQHFASAQETGFLWRGSLIGSDMFAYSVVASQPFKQIYNRDDDSGQFPKFNFMQGNRLSGFVGTGKIAIWLWLGILATGAALFVRSLWKEKLTVPNRFALAALACLAFNFVFHAIYGFEPFLYAADWIFALILFVALGTRRLAGSLWFQIVMLALIALLTLNNLSFLFTLMNGVSPFIPSS